MPDTERKNRTRVLWRLIDGKRGHDNQSLGLANALARLVPAERHDIPAPGARPALTDLLTGRCRFATWAPNPDLIIGAGRATHLPMLAARRARGGRAVVLMKPGLPRPLFDLCIIPRHDGVAERGNVIVTEGALNAITPSDAHDPAQGLILIGGFSRHYRWNDAAVLQQVRQILDTDPRRHWTITDSRRTPAAAIKALSSLPAANVTYASHTTTGQNWVPERLACCGIVWVTEDSVSMVYEAITSGAAVGLIDVPIAGTNRVTHAVRQLVENRCLTTFIDWRAGATLKPSRVPLNEAARCAGWIMDHWG